MATNSGNLVFMVHRTHDILKSCEDRVFGEHELTTEQYMVLSSIKCLDSPVRVTDVARQLARSANSVSMIVDRMVKAGLVRRIRDLPDRREVRLVIASKGEEALKPATLAGQEFTQKMLSHVSYEDKQNLTRLLETLQHKASGYPNTRSQL